MKSRLFLRLILLAVFLAACAPAKATVSPTQPEDVAASATPAPTLDAPAQGTEVPTEALESTPLPVATSRGPELHATDPTTVNLASGGLQLVEFFRFT